MLLSWIAGASNNAEGPFLKLFGHRNLKNLLAALNATSANVTDAERKTA